MSLHKSRIPKLSDSSRKFIPEKQRKAMNDPFVERTERTHNKKGEKVSGGKVEIRSQKASEDKKATLEQRPVQTPLWMTIGRGLEPKEMGIRDLRVSLFP